jgi:hypothetical protein
LKRADRLAQTPPLRWFSSIAQATCLDGLSLSPPEPFLGRKPPANPPAFAANVSLRRGGLAMSRRLKLAHRPASQYNAYLAGWAFAFAVVLVTFMLIGHGVHF